MSSFITALSIAFTLVLFFGSGLSDPPNPCGTDVEQLSFAIESDDVPEDCGGMLVLASVKSAPDFLKYAGADTNEKYTLLMVDPDVPNSTNPELKYYIHWLLESIPGADLKDGHFIVDKDAEEPETPSYTERLSYMPPNPGKGSGSHRYQFYVYQQSAASLNNVPPVSRTNFDVSQFAKDNALGPALAAFQFTSEKTSDSEL